MQRDSSDTYSSSRKRRLCRGPRGSLLMLFILRSLEGKTDSVWGAVYAATRKSSCSVHTIPSNTVKWTHSSAWQMNCNFPIEISSPVLHPPTSWALCQIRDSRKSSHGLQNDLDHSWAKMIWVGQQRKQTELYSRHNCMSCFTFCDKEKCLHHATLEVLILWEFKHLVKTNVLIQKNLKQNKTKSLFPPPNMLLLQVLRLH